MKKIEATIQVNKINAISVQLLELQEDLQLQKEMEEVQGKDRTLDQREEQK